MTPLPIAKLGTPILRQIAAEVTDIYSVNTKDLICAMIRACNDAKGVGIAGPQVAQSLRIFIMRSLGPTKLYPEAPFMDPIAVINPEIQSVSDEMVMGREGCLSIPGIWGLVPRHKRVIVSYTNGDGMKVERTFEGYLARIFQHEFDHLNAILYIDRVNSEELVIEPGYEDTYANLKLLPTR